MLPKLCLESQGMIFQAIEEVMEAFNYTNLFLIKAFHCPYCADIHAAEPKESHGEKYLHCTKGKTDVSNPVWEDKHQIWVSPDHSVVTQEALCTELGELKDWDNSYTFNSLHNNILQHITISNQTK